MPTAPATCIRTRASIRSTACRRWCAASTRRCSAPTRSRRWSASTARRWRISTIWCRSSRTRRPVSAVPLNAFELMKAMIEAGAAAVHFEDQLASEKKCGHLGGKVLVPTRTFIRTLNAARLAADVMGVPTLIMARTDAEAARLITSDIDEYDAPFVTGERTPRGLLPAQGRLRGGDRARHRLRRLCRPRLVRDIDAESRRCAAFRRGGPQGPSRPDARL